MRKKARGERACSCFFKVSVKKKKKKKSHSLPWFFFHGGEKPYFSRSFASVGGRTIPFGREVLWGVANRTFAPYVISFTGAWAGKKTRIFFPLSKGNLGFQTPLSSHHGKSFTYGTNVRLATPWRVSLPKGMVLRASDKKMLLKSAWRLPHM